MKNIMKKLSVALMATAIIWSCGKDDGPEPPKNTTPVIKAHTFTVAETIADTETIGTVKATDADGDALTFSIKTNDKNLFEITKAGALSLASGKTLDAASSTEHSITVSVTDGTATATAKVTIKVTPVDPENQSPVMSAQEFTVSEDITDTHEIGQVEATDPEDDELTFELVANDNDLFFITGAGMLTLAEGKTLDFGTATEHSITVRVSDGNTTANAEITIKVTQVATNSAPVIEAQEFTAKEDIADTDVIGTVTATDADGDELTFELTENDNDLFLLTAAGELTLAEGKTLDFETATEHSITVSVTDGEETAEATITISVENVIESMAEDPASFITTWETETDGEQITIGIVGNYTYNYTIDWGDGTVEELTEADGVATHVYATAGTYTVAIQGEFPSIYMEAGSFLKLLSLEQWGNIQWKSFYSAFGNCENMMYNATDAPDLSNVTNMKYMFYGATSFNGDISNWDVSNVTTLSHMFREATSFNGDVSAWGAKLGNVTDMQGMFYGATSFNGDVSNWDVSNVTSMGYMFNGASSFDRDLGNWNIGNVTNMAGMLDNSGMSKANFNTTLIGWHAYVEENGSPIDVALGAEGLTICGLQAYEAGADLEASYGWSIEGSPTIEESCN